MASIETVVTFLEMNAEPTLHAALPANLKCMLVRAERPSVRFYRYLYDAVGRGYSWIDRKKLNDLELETLIRQPDVEVWVLYLSGEPAGYFEITATGFPVVELEYFGLIPDFHGLGLGNWFLAEAIRACWSRKPDRVIVQTCTLDGPAALPLYQKLGFVPYDRQHKVMELLD